MNTFVEPKGGRGPTRTGNRELSRNLLYPVELHAQFFGGLAGWQVLATPTPSAAVTLTYLMVANTSLPPISLYSG